MAKTYHLYPIFVKGDNEQEVKMRVVALKNSAQNYGGFVSMQEGEGTEMSMLFAFEDARLMYAWSNSIHTL